MKKSGGFIPGIRPGKATSDYLTKILNRIIFIGAIGLTVVALIPVVFSGLFNANVSFGGTSIIIIVGVILETIRQIESQMVVRDYKGFLMSKGECNMKIIMLGAPGAGKVRRQIKYVQSTIFLISQPEIFSGQILK